MSNDETRGEDRQNLEAACEAHGWRLRVTGEPPETSGRSSASRLLGASASLPGRETLFERWCQGPGTTRAKRRLRFAGEHEMSNETKTKREFVVRRDIDRWVVRIDSTDQNRDFPRVVASAGTGMSNLGSHAVIVEAYQPQTLREIGEALIAASEQIERESGE